MVPSVPEGWRSQTEPDWCNSILMQQFECRSQCYTLNVNLTGGQERDIKLYLEIGWLRPGLMPHCIQEFFRLSLSTCIQCLPVCKALSHPSCDISLTVPSEVEGIIVSVVQMRQGA